ncbi:MAG: hypothetical protein AAGH65_09970 [Pseudomonadota bacterium]
MTLAIYPSGSVNLLLSLARFDEAIEVGEQLVEQDPLGYIARVNLALTYIMGGQFNPAIDLCRQLLDETDQRGGPCLSALVLGLSYSGQGEAALEALSLADSERLHVRLAPRAYLAAGDTQAFDDSMIALKRRFDSGDTGLASALARSYAFSGDHEAALHWLTIAIDNGGTLMAPGLSYYQSLEDQPEYQALLLQTGNDQAQLDQIEFELRERQHPLLD